MEENKKSSDFCNSYDIKKHRGYQDYLIKDFSWFNKFLIKNAEKFRFIYKNYYRLTRTSIYQLKSIPNIKIAEKILDIGCGQGDILNYIKKYFNSKAELYGVDLEKNKILPDFIHFSEVDIDEKKLPFEDNFFNVVISTFVLEHLKQPDRLFRESYRVLKKGGFFYCTTDYYTSIFFPDEWNFYSDPTHVRPWTKKSLKTFANMYGFEIVKIGRIRPVECFLLFPFVPFLNYIFRVRASFIIWEGLLGKTLYCIMKKN